MTQGEFIGMLVIAIPTLCAVVAPILRLNTSIVKLETTLSHVNENLKTQTNRINEHGREIDELKISVAGLKAKNKKG